MDGEIKQETQSTLGKVLEVINQNIKLPSGEPVTEATLVDAINSMVQAVGQAQQQNAKLRQMLKEVL